MFIIIGWYIQLLLIVLALRYLYNLQRMIVDSYILLTQISKQLARLSPPAPPPPPASSPD